MKYKLLKTLTSEFVKEYDPCEEEFNKFVRKYGFTENIEWNKETEDYMLKQNGWIDFLIDTDFIDKKKTIIFDQYKIYLIVGNSKSTDTIFKLGNCNDNKFYFDRLSSSVEVVGAWYNSGQEAIDTAIKDNYNVIVCNNISEMIEKLKGLI